VDLLFTLKQYWQKVIARFKNRSSDHAQARDQVKVLELSLADISSQLKHQGDQLKFLQDSTAERAEVFMAALADAANRLENRDDELRHQQESVGEQVRVLESSLAKNSSRLAVMDDQLITLENKLDSEHQQNQYTVQELRTQLRKHDQHLSWTVLAASVTLALLTLTGAILIWDEQKNAELLAGISQDIKDIMRPNVSVMPYPGKQYNPVQHKQTTQSGDSVNTKAPGTGGIDTNKTELHTAEPPTGEAKRPVDKANATISVGEDADKKGEATLPSGLRYNIITQGSGRPPKATDRLMFHHCRIFPECKEHDPDHEPDSSVTSGINLIGSIVTEVLPYMKEGTQWELYMPSVPVDDSGSRMEGMDLEPITYQIELISVIEEGVSSEH
jgi:FKBP-type peptidyl-prolyl cis-trans isomerase